jgi:hypothetical protein
MMKLSPIPVRPWLGHLLARAFSPLTQAASATIRVAKTGVMKLLGRSDYQRWVKPDSCLAWWSSRTQRIAQLIPDGSVVIEFGAGSRLLEPLLASSCVYVPSDLVDRGPGTVICDLNKRPLPDLEYLLAHVAVFVGVFEYLSGFPSLIEWLSHQATFCVVSYECIRTKPFMVSWFFEMLHRAHNGYLSYYSEEQLVALFEANGFACTNVETWRDQRLFVFAKRDKLGKLIHHLHSLQPIPAGHSNRSVEENGNGGETVPV